MEREIFAECGSWKNFDDLEGSLTLEELMELYEISCERQMRLTKTLAQAFGAEIEESSNDFSSGPMIYDGNDLGQLPIGIGYEQT